MSPFTPAQDRAIHTLDRNLVVVAGAGSGKTRVLVERYLRLLDTHPEWELNQVVAITFTQKAAQEMRDRVRTELLKRMEAAQTNGDSRAMALWSKRVSAMDSARIDTIHALCADILRQNAAEAGIDPTFEVLDDVEARTLRESVMDDLLVALAANDDPVIELFTEYRADDVRTALTELLADQPDTPADDLMRHWRELWEADARRTIETLLADPAFRQAATWHERGLPTGEDKLLDVWKICQMHLSTLISSQDWAVQLASLRQLKEAIKLNGGKAGVWGGREIMEEAKAVLNTLRERAEEVLKFIGDEPGDVDEHAAQLLPHWAALLRLMRSAYTDAKRERGVLDFDDLEALTRLLLREREDVRRRYRGAEFRHLLVDEFQDTNDAQWDIVRLLAPPEAQGTLFVVGDPKQSIYSFRRADVRVFGEAQQVLSSQGGEIVSLARSFRTHAPLVACFNTLFSRILMRDSASIAADYQVDLGEPMDAARGTSPQDDPFIELWIIDRTDKEDDDARGVGQRAEAEAIAERIHALIRARTLVYDRALGTTRPMGYGDCTLLFRSMTDAPVYEDVFKAAGLPYVTIAGKGYYNRQEVADVLNLLRAIYHPGDNLALATALRSPLFALSDDALYALRSRRGEDGMIPPLWDALADPTGLPADEAEALACARATLLRLRSVAGRVPIAELLEMALDATDYLAVLTGLTDGARRRGNIEKLLEKARSSGKLTLGEFSQYLKDLSETETREGEASLDATGAVTLMTIHKSKGLEFPVVFLVDAQRESSDSAALLVNDPQVGLACRVYDAKQDKMTSPFAYRRAALLHKARDDAENRRLLYVAMTRAQDRLIISGYASRRANEEGWNAKGWLGQIIEGFELGNCEPGTHSFDWGQFLIRQIPARREPTHREPPPAAWELHQAAPAMPPLLAAVRFERDASARALSASQIAHLGGFATEEMPERRSRYRLRLLHSLLRDAPERIDRVKSTRSSQVSARRIGEIVHRALRWWQFPTDRDDLRDILRSYAWEEGIVEPEHINIAINEARNLLRGFQSSPLWAMIDEARRDGQHFPELPILYQTDKRTIQGKLDALIVRPDGAHAVIDYKSSTMRDGANPQVAAQHARRYYLQVGVYAAAIQRLTGAIPDIYIHYIRYNHTIRVTTEAWQSALAQLESVIGDAIGQDDD